MRPPSFQLTMKKHLEDDDKRQEIEEMEKRVRQAVEGKKEVTETLD